MPLSQLSDPALQTLDVNVVIMGDEAAMPKSTKKGPTSLERPACVQDRIVSDCNYWLAGRSPG